MSAPAFSHILVAGASQCGKSTKLHRMSRASKRKLIIYDPTIAPIDTPTIRGVGWRHSLADAPDGASRETMAFADAPGFLECVADERDADIFIDEAQDILSVAGRANHWLMTRGRHQGFRLIIATQRPKLIAPSVRGQVAIMYLFRLAHSDMRDSLADAGCTIKVFKEFPEYTPLAAGEFLRLDLANADIRFFAETADGMPATRQSYNGDINGAGVPLIWRTL